jgi:alpha,alpha-trehalase
LSELIPYPALERHGLIGDRRTAALVAADGTIDWLCLPDYDGEAAFGALLDAGRGGFWRVGPARLWTGEQTYVGDTPVLRTRWSSDEYALELCDAMASARDERASGSEDTRVILRRLHCLRGAVDCVSLFHPFAAALRLWSSRPHLSSAFRLSSGDVVWLVASYGETPPWNVERADHAMHDVEAFWRDTAAQLRRSIDDSEIVRSAITLRLLEFAPAGSSVAAPTTSLPERIGGDWNADYRLTWVRDASLAMATLARLGDLESAARYLEWLARLEPSDQGAPLQVLYSIRGDRSVEQRDRHDRTGYRGSKPVRIGNNAFKQCQLDIFGYLADCVLVFLEHGGRWRRKFWPMLRRSADYVSEHWREPDHGIWELEAKQHYVASRVMCWTALERTLRIADRIGESPAKAAAWRAAARAIRDEVLRAGWSERRRAFTQALRSDVLDASALLIPLTGFLPADDDRVRATVDRIAEELTIDGLTYRFNPGDVPEVQGSAMGEFESAFMPCTFWLASACALLGRERDAHDVLAAAQRVAGPVGLYAEAIDPRGPAFAGNTPLLFSHVEHIRARQLLRRMAHRAETSQRAAG